MKKIIALILTLTTAAALASCGGGVLTDKPLTR